MAKTVPNEEERLRRIVLVGEYVKVTGESTRKTARFFTEPELYLTKEKRSGRLTSIAAHRRSMPKTHASWSWTIRSEAQ